MTLYQKIIKLKRPYIIAEIGAKYLSINKILKTIDAAKSAGVDMVKFQTYKAKNIALNDNKYFRVHGKKIKQYDFFKKFELSYFDHLKIKKHCEKIAIDWCSTPSHFDDVDMLNSLNVKCFKIGSDDLTNIALLDYISKKKKTVILSTGMAKLDEIINAVKVVKKNNKELIVLHCNTSYPVNYGDINLLFINKLKKFLKLPIGFSDHTVDDQAAILATSIGAKVIEKHFILNKKYKIPDSQVSLDPKEMNVMIKKIQNVNKIFGKEDKILSRAEKNWIKIARKSIFAKEDIVSGQKFSLTNLEIKRPLIGLNAKNFNKLIGKKSKINIKKGKVLPKNYL